MEAARFCGLQALAQLRKALGSLDRIECVVRTLGMVNADPDFGGHPRVINGFADLMVDVFGEEAGHGARSAGRHGLSPERYHGRGRGDRQAQGLTDKSPAGGRAGSSPRSGGSGASRFPPGTAARERPPRGSARYPWTRAS